MFELPLFPLQTVLFPGMPLPLQIFEDRYHEMIRLCLDEERPFGVVFIREGTAERGPLARPYTIGCTAAITQVQRLDADRLFILTIGQERFRIASLQKDRPYLVGQVERFPLEIGPPAQLQAATDRLHPLVIEYLGILARAGKVEFDPSQISTAPEVLGFLAASFIQIPMTEKQALLETKTAAGLLNALQTIYRQELALMRTMPHDDMGLFSLS